ncbi:Oxoglutarate/iron-dependent dioxygenase [Corchorus olitorius]|uniref:Oxoglutarate/iron-dependent dioxygenase n=1 Tax=Corchorus olitorius TaxID=93759 RepID=A0A1R3FZA4_9ROSI|nr:Oxoglutarate/iron-dependent dioxygenase [Corchorus olitorius]
MDPNDIITLFEGGLQAIRMNYYPPCPEPELSIGLNSHSDAAGITILLQINEVEGLQIRKNGAWIPVKPLANAFVINIGDIMEIVSNGIYPSIEHRATVNSNKERLSIATYYSPKLDGDMGPAPSLITPQTPALFKRIGVADYYKGFFSRELRGRAYLDAMRVQNPKIQSKM